MERMEKRMGGRVTIRRAKPRRKTKGFLIASLNRIKVEVGPKGKAERRRRWKNELMIPILPHGSDVETGDESTG